MKKFSVGFFLAILVIILAAASMILYTANGKNIYSTTYLSKIYICCGLAIFFALLSIGLTFVGGSVAPELIRPSRAIAFLLLLYATLQYILTQALFLGAVFVAIDVDQYGPLVPGFVATIACMALGAILALASVCLEGCRPGTKSSEVMA